MRRNLSLLASRPFDLTVVGGGILGAFIASRAARRGLRVALVEKGDFASGTTSASGKVLHGGIRYLQGLQLSLAREAQREQSALAAMAPELVRTLPFLVPCRRGHLRERLVLRAGTLAWQGFRRFMGEGSRLPATRFLGTSETDRLVENLEGRFDGGMLFHDVQLRSPERLTFEVLRRAREDGAVISNYTKVVNLRTASGRIVGLEARDRIGGDVFGIDTSHVVNAAGAWAPEVAGGAAGSFPDVAFGKGIHVVLDRPEPAAALALPHGGQDSRNPASSGERRIFVMPWEGCTLVGASYSPHRGSPDAVGVSRDEIRGFLRRLDAAWPGLGLDDSRILYAYAGLYPVFGARSITGERYSASLHPRIVEHGRGGGPEGLLSVMSVKLTTARRLAERTVDLLLGSSPHPSEGGSESDEGPAVAGELESGALNPSSDLPLGEPEALPDVARRAASEEMALTLPDVLFRRSWIGHKGPPGREALEEAAEAMSDRLDWPDTERERQIRRAEEVYAGLGIRSACG